MPTDCGAERGCILDTDCEWESQALSDCFVSQRRGWGLSQGLQHRCCTSDGVKMLWDFSSPAQIFLFPACACSRLWNSNSQVSIAYPEAWHSVDWSAGYKSRTGSKSQANFISDKMVPVPLWKDDEEVVNGRGLGYNLQTVEYSLFFYCGTWGIIFF